MYCINCGVKLTDTEKRCPLCGTVPFHPDLIRPETESLYPNNRYPAPQVSPKGALVVVSTVFLLPMPITLLCDLQVNRAVTWSGFVVGALLTAYVTLVLPFWFHKPNPVVFVPIGFAAIGLYLLYIDLATGGEWFLSFAFPVVGFVGVVTTTIVVLTRYLRRGRLYIFGGAAIAIGLFMPLMEFLLNLTFRREHFIGWSIYPLVTLVLLGGMLLFLAICRPARETMERKFFL